ncbi:MAG: UDP-N-acetylmuramate dehydrogenase [Deltaproteobacteria bacterium]|nr:UDP-N-acetylmuramate dehydrogenase [Deltaproteobacteria bacterium]MBN2672665.1 UDP-N-acetylmuramate dehydrogenase [Deltaproteobacteria bacterium]
MNRQHPQPFSPEAAIRIIQAGYNGIVETDVPLKQFTSFYIGGPAALYTRVSRPDDASQLLKTVSSANIPYLIIGGGTNLLVSDDGFEGLAVHARFDKLHITPDGLVSVGASVQVSNLVEQTVSAGFAGLEFAAGLPGTVGGAVAGNAGCFGSSFGDVLHSARILTAQGDIQTVSPEWFQFEYRCSEVNAQKALVVEARFQLHKGDRNALRQTADSHTALRREKHPARHIKTAGSYFKNLPPLHPGERRRAAGILLEEIGAKNESVGDAAVFEKHANILINRANATAKDMLTLETRLRRKVFKQFGELLEPEVRFIGRRPVIDEPGPAV